MKLRKSSVECKLHVKFIVIILITSTSLSLHILKRLAPLTIIIIIMYIYLVLISTLSAHMIHVNLNMIFYTHVEHRPTKTIKYYKKIQQKTALHTHIHTDCSRNWVLILGWKYCHQLFELDSECKAYRFTVSVTFFCWYSG